MRCHRFTDWTDANLPDWTLSGFLPNRYPPVGASAADTSFSDFHFFSRRERLSPKYSCLFEDRVTGAEEPPDEEAAELFRTAEESARQGRLDKSAECLKAAAANRNLRLKAINSLGAVLGAMGRHQEAEEAMKAVLARDRKNMQARLNLTKLYVSLDRWADLAPFMLELNILRKVDKRVAARWPLIIVKVGTRI
jgi:tetratricopeptide (TPR) repeat protein